MKVQKKKQNGITLIALVISIIVMLILAGVSLNLTIGDNGIIKQAQSATYQTGMAIFEEWLQQEYVKNYDKLLENDNQNKVEFLNRMFDYSLLLKDGTRNYIINEGKIYYLLDKSCNFIPQDIKNGLLGGDTREYSKYTRLQDVYGITKDLTVYYFNDDSIVQYGKLENYDINPNASAVELNGNSGLKNVIIDEIINKYNQTIDNGSGITLSNTMLFNKDLEIDGEKFPGITNLSGIGELKGLKELTLSNLTLTSLNGLEGIPNLRYLYLKNTTVGDYEALASCINLNKLYIYLPDTINESTANEQVEKLGEGLRNASEIKNLAFFGISGSTVMFEKTMKMEKPSNALGNSTSSNSLKWKSEEKSNVTSLGENTSTTKTGLYAFNNRIKSTLNYVYLNNNRFNNVGALSEFSEIVELTLMCNSNLSNIDGLTSHEKLERLTLQNCNLLHLGSYNSETKKYYGGLTGCHKINKLSVQENSNLESLVGLEDAIELEYLVASNCNLKNVNSLAGHSNISYLDLANNVYLSSVKYIQHCKALNYIYLDNNIRMSSDELDKALNGKDNTLGTDKLITNCLNGYANIPSIYDDLWLESATILDYSVEKVGTLTTNSAKWVKLKGRSDVTKLKLDGQTSLQMDDRTETTIVDGEQTTITYYGISSTLSTLTGMKALSLKSCSQVDSINFVEGMSNLYEIDLRSISTTLVDLSKLNGCTSLNRLFCDNTSIQAKKIITTINRFKAEYGTDENSWRNKPTWEASGLVCPNNKFPDFSECGELKKFAGGNMMFGSTEGNLDLSTTGITSFGYYRNPGLGVSLPSSCSSVLADNASDFRLTMQRKENVYVYGNWFSTTFLNSFIGKGYSNFRIMSKSGSNLIIPKGLFNIVNFIILGDYYKGQDNIDFNSITEKENINNSIMLEDFGNILNINKLGYLSDLNRLFIRNCNITDISWISSLSNLTYLDLSNNNISNITAIGSLKNITDYHYNISGTQVKGNLSLAGNNISDLTPLVNMIGTDGKVKYTILDVSNNSLEGYTVADNITTLLKLHKANLKKVYVTGNNFTNEEINELISGKKVTNSDGTSIIYEGFGAGNVIN